jgi:hypothetical protein
MPSTDTPQGISARRQNSAQCWTWSLTGVFLLSPHLSSRLPILILPRILWSGSSIPTNRATTSCLLCYLSSAYPQRALIFQFLIALDFSSHYMHMYRYYHFPTCLFIHMNLTCSRSSLVTGSKSHKLVTSDVSRILWFYYNDPVRPPPHQM